nr:VOC family protein [Candidatus Woesebacteria bacterium]
LVGCSTKEEVQAIWDKISVGGMALMELGAYPFSEWYGWIQDKFGVSWQIMWMGERPITQRIIPTMMFVGENCGKAEEAVNFYTSVFHESSIGDSMRYQKGEEPDKEGTIKHMQFVLEGFRFAIMDSAHEHQFALNEAVSLIIHCQSQEEIDYYWEKLSANPESEQCGWLKDKFGLSWQVTPVALQGMLEDPNPAKVEAVTQAFLKMKKFDVAALEQVFNSVG